MMILFSGVCAADKLATAMRSALHDIRPGSDFRCLILLIRHIVGR